MLTFINKLGISPKKLLFPLSIIFSLPGSYLTLGGKTLLCLIPKTTSVSKPNQLRPIGLVSTHYKIVSKLIVSRLKPFLTNLISPCEGEFQKGRQASDLFTIAHEIQHSMHLSKSKFGWVILKVDIHKAFDNLS